MPKLSPVSWKELVKRLSELGFSGPAQGSKHPIMRKGGLTLVIPNPHRHEVSVALLSKLLNRAGISHEEWWAK